MQPGLKMKKMSHSPGVEAKDGKKCQRLFFDAGDMPE